METLIEEVTNLLNEHFHGNNVVELEETIPGQKIGGSFVSDAFVNMQQIDRQQSLRHVINEHLPMAERLRVGTILTLTPQEVGAMQSMAV